MSSLLKSSDEKLRDQDIQALLEAGVDMVQLEDLYGPKAVHRVAEAYITSNLDAAMMGDTDKDANKKHQDRRSKLATLLFLRAPSSSLQSIMKSSDVVDAVFEALVADPEDPLLMDPLLHTPLHDPVVLSSGIIVDRSTAMDPLTGKLRLQKCPYRRIPLSLPVYEVLPLQERVREWERSRLERCVSVAQTMMSHQQYDRVEKVFQISAAFLQEHQHRLEKIKLSGGGGRDNNTIDNSPTTMISTTHRGAPKQHQAREILLLALQLAQLERELPGVKDDVPRTVDIHRRLIAVAKACSTDKADLETLVQACLEDCWKRCSMLLAFAGKNASDKALGIRHAFRPLIKYTILMQLNMTDLLQKLCHLDLTLAKHVEDEPSIWNCRRVLLKLLPEKERTEFLQTEGITGEEEDLYYHLLYDASLWNMEKFTDPAIGLVHFGTNSSASNNNSNNNTTSHGDEPDGPVPTETTGLLCKVNLNPHPSGDHWIEVAFRPDYIQSPGHLNSILSQHGDGSGWEIRCAVKPRAGINFGQVLFMSTNNNNGKGDKRDAGGIHVEAVWTTTTNNNNNNGRNNKNKNAQHNEFTNTKVPLEIGTWYHVILAYCHELSTLSLYVNGQVVRKQVSGSFVPAGGALALPRMGQNMQWLERRFQGWIAFAGGGYELPVNGADFEAMDDYVQKLTKARLSKLPKEPAQHRPRDADADEEEDNDTSSGIGDGSSSCLESMSVSSASAFEDGHEHEHEEEDSSSDHDGGGPVVV